MNFIWHLVPYAPIVLIGLVLGHLIVKNDEDQEFMDRGNKCLLPLFVIATTFSLFASSKLDLLPEWEGIMKLMNVVIAIGINVAVCVFLAVFAGLLTPVPK